MAQTVKQLLDDVLSLPDETRAYVAEVLLESLDIGDDFPISDAWRREIDKRCSEIDEGKVTLVPGDEAMARLKKRVS